ncbi:MAG: ATP-binding protein [Thermoanaerobaculum sp.]
MRLAAKLTIIVAMGLVVVFGAMTALNLWLLERATLRILQINGRQLGDMVVAATRDGMLHNDTERIQATVEALARQGEMGVIRIMRKDGTIMYSSIPAEIGRRLSLNDEQCVVCHTGSLPPRELPPELRTRLVAGERGRALGVIQTILNEKECSQAACHVHPQSETLLGILDVNVWLTPHEEIQAKSAAGMTLVSILGIALGIGATALAVRHMVHLRVRTLIDHTRKIAAGDLSARVPEVGNDELADLARHFNRMARDLEAAREELLEWGRTLEMRVEEKAQELERAKDHILQVEKMASLGKLAAGVAHEINNPLSSVVTYAKVLIRRLQTHELSEECKENLRYLDAIVSEASRCGRIVNQLLSFARKKDGDFIPTNLNEVAEKAVFLVHHKLELSNVKPVMELQPDLPSVIADAGQVQQALMALLINAAEAMAWTGGFVKVATAQADGGVLVVVEDNGPGMTPEVAARAFEPFFTTKSQGGVGLGLSVVYGIVERHGGHIDLQTAPGAGCRITLFFPLVPATREGKEES